MSSGKSTNLLMVAHNYEEQGKDVLIYTSAVDTRSKENSVESRIGINKPAKVIHENTNVLLSAVDYINQNKGKDVYCILIDEAQFLSKEHIIQLAQIVDELHIPVIAYGLKNDFSNNLFEGSESLLIYADKIEELKTICTFCDKRATMNLRTDEEGNPLYEGEQIQVGDELYIPVCRRHYNNPQTNVK